MIGLTKRKVPIAAKSAMPNVYHTAIFPVDQSHTGDPTIDKAERKGKDQRGFTKPDLERKREEKRCAFDDNNVQESGIARRNGDRAEDIYISVRPKQPHDHFMRCYFSECLQKGTDCCLFDSAEARASRCSGQPAPEDLHGSLPFPRTLPLGAEEAESRSSIGVQPIEVKRAMPLSRVGISSQHFL